MRLTLRTLLAYLDDTLEPAQARIIGQKVAESDQARELMDHIKQVARRRRITTPPGNGPGSIDPNMVAEYLDGAVSGEQAGEVEQVCLASDVHLAEIAACHQILALVLGEPALVPPTAKSRMYGLVKGPESIHFRKPTNPLPADKEESGLGGEDIDETLRMGLPFLGGEGKWTNIILLLASGLAASVLLFLAIWHVLHLGTEDQDSGQYVAQANDKAEKEEKKEVPPVKQPEPKKKDTKEPKDVKKDTKAPNDGKDAKNLEKKDKDTKGNEKPPDFKLPPPPDPKDVLPSDPKDLPPPVAEKGDSLPENRFTEADNRPLDIGKYVTPAAKNPGFVVTRFIGTKGINDDGKDNKKLDKKDKDANVWARLFGTKVKVESGCTYVSLPGFRSDLQLERGLLLSLVGNIPEFDPMPIMESAVDLHRNDACVDLTLLRGRIMLTCTKNAPVAVRVRFENPSNPQKADFADLLLLEKGTTVVVDCFVPPISKAEFTRCFLGIDGKAKIRINDDLHELTGPPGKTLLTWDQTSKVEYKNDGMPIAIWTGTPPVLDKLEPARKKYLEAILKAREALSVLVGTKPVDVGLAENWKQMDPIRRMLVVRSYAALGFLDEIIETLKDAKLADAHFYAIGGLQQFLKSAPGNEELLTRALTSQFSSRIADRVVDLLRGNVRDPSLLIDNLGDNDLLVRQVSYYNLIGILGWQSIPYDPMLSEPQMTAQQQWRALLKKQENAPKK